MTDQRHVAVEAPTPHQYALLARVYYFLGHVDKSLATFREGLAVYPDHPVLLRHRGHRLITERQFDAALTDLTKAAAQAKFIPDEIEFYQPQVEEDLRGLILGSRTRAYPIPVNASTLREYAAVYKGTLRASIWYHIGLVHYVRGEFEHAVEAYGRALANCHDDDMRVATIDWLYLSLMRADRSDEATSTLALIHDEMHILERSYFRRLQVYRGQADPYELLHRAGEDGNYATQAYGVGAWLLCTGDARRASEVFEAVVKRAPPSSFGFLCAEAELSRLGRHANE